MEWRSRAKRMYCLTKSPKACHPSPPPASIRRRVQRPAAKPPLPPPSHLAVPSPCREQKTRWRGRKRAEWASCHFPTCRPCNQRRLEGKKISTAPTVNVRCGFGCRSAGGGEVPLLAMEERPPAARRCGTLDCLTVGLPPAIIAGGLGCKMSEKCPR